MFFCSHLMQYGDNHQLINIIGHSPSGMCSLHATSSIFEFFLDFFIIIIDKYGRDEDEGKRMEGCRQNWWDEMMKMILINFVVVKWCSALPQCINIIENWDFFPLVPDDIPNANTQCESTRLDSCVCLNFMVSTMNTINLFRSTEQRNRLKMIFLYAKHMHNVFKAHKLYGFSIFFCSFASNTKFLHQFVLCLPIAHAALQWLYVCQKAKQKNTIFRSSMQGKKGRKKRGKLARKQ